jgi:hypothetical protein
MSEIKKQDGMGSMFGIDDAINAVAGLADTAIKRIWPDATEVEKAKAEQLAAELQAEYKLMLGQLKINEAEAKNASVFVSGARPFILWTCGLSLCYVSIIEPIARFFAVVVFEYHGAFPEIDTDITFQILSGMLGLAGMRSFEKSKGVARK